MRERGWKLPSSVLDEALDNAVDDVDQRRALSDLAAQIRDTQQTEGPRPRPDLRYAEAEQAGIRPAPRSADEADVANTLARGNLGERTATDWLAANGYEILDYKPDIGGTNKPGIDMVAIRDNTVYLLDNKALTRDGDIRSVSALTTNFDDRPDRPGNLSRTIDALRAMTDDAKRPANETALAQRALAALEDGRYVRAVTNANVAPDRQLISGVSERLKSQYKIEFIDVMRKK